MKKETSARAEESTKKKRGFASDVSTVVKVQVTGGWNRTGGVQNTVARAAGQHAIKGLASTNEKNTIGY